MASLIPSFDTSMTRHAMQSQAGMLQNLGQQIRQDITTLVASRQMKGLAEGLQSVDTTSPQFGRQVAGLMSQYPLAAQSQLGQAAINQLGSEFKLNQQIAAEDRRFRNQLGGYAAKDYIENRPYGAPVTADGLYNVANGRGTSGGSAGSASPSTYQEPPLPDGGIPTQGSPNLFGDPGFVGPQQPGIPAAQPQIIPGVANPNAGNPPSPVAPINNVGAQIQAYDQQLRQQRVPQHLAEGMLRSYAQSLTAQQRPGSTRLIEDAERGTMMIGPDGVARPVPVAGGGNPIRKPAGGNLDNTETDNRREDAKLRFREITTAQKRIDGLVERMNKTEVGMPGPWKENGKWYKMAEQPKGREVIDAEVAQKWLDLNHELKKAQGQFEKATKEYEALKSPASVGQVFNYDPTSKLTPVQ